MKKYYSVTVKCGHVGRNNYIVKELPIRAENGKEAASIAREKPRVKHDDKEAIFEVRELLKDQYIDLLEQFNNDPFFKCTNIQEQRSNCIGIEDEIVYSHGYRDFEKPDRRWKASYSNKKNKIYKKETRLETGNYFEY